MPTHKKSKRAVRARMEKTGESYTAARAALQPDEVRGSGKISVVDMTPELLAAALRKAVVPHGMLADVDRACLRLAATPGVRAAILWNTNGDVICERGADEALRARVRERLIAEAQHGSIDLIAPLAGGDGLLFCMRQLKVRASMTHGMSRWLAFTPTATAVPMYLYNGQLVFFLTAVLEGDEALELLRLRVGHAVLAIERALAGGARAAP
jgi:hypothetical protein